MTLVKLVVSMTTNLKKPYVITGAYPLCTLTGPASEMEPGVLPLVLEYTGDPIMHSTWNIALYPGS